MVRDSGARRGDLRPVAESRNSKQVNEPPEEGRGPNEPPLDRAGSVSASSADTLSVSPQGSRSKLGFFSEQRQNPTNVFDTEQTEVSRRRVNEVTSQTARGWVPTSRSAVVEICSSSRSAFDERIEESSIPVGFALARPSVEKARNGARSAPHARNLEAGWGGGLRAGGSRPPAEGAGTCRGASHRADTSLALGPSGGHCKVSLSSHTLRTLQSAKSMHYALRNSRVEACTAEIGGANR